MVVECDLGVERFRHGIAMRCDVCQMTACQPQLGECGQEDGGDEDERELCGGHGVIAWGVRDKARYNARRKILNDLLTTKGA
jgi:hypothetical protein